jgi:hypothetical protein
MRKSAILLTYLVTLLPAQAAYETTEILFKAPTVPKIDKPACAKVEILKKVTVPASPSSGLLESFEFTYMVTLEPGCNGTLTLTSTYESNSNHHTESIKKSYAIKDGKLSEGR